MMADTGWLSPSTIVDDSAVGTLTWNNPGNAAAQDDVRASVSGYQNQQTHYLRATNFGFSVPTGATIDGVEVGFDAYQSGGTVPYTVVKLVVSGSVAGTNKGTGYFATSDTDTYTAFGGVADVWGNSLTPAIVNASNFGVVLSVNMQNPSSFYAYVDHVRLKVYYTESGTEHAAAGSGTAVATGSAAVTCSYAVVGSGSAAATGSAYASGGGAQHQVAGSGLAAAAGSGAAQCAYVASGSGEAVATGSASAQLGGGVQQVAGSGEAIATGAAHTAVTRGLSAAGLAAAVGVASLEVDHIMPFVVYG